MCTYIPYNFLQIVPPSEGSSSFNIRSSHSRKVMFSIMRHLTQLKQQEIVDAIY